MATESKTKREAKVVTIKRLEKRVTTVHLLLHDLLMNRATKKMMEELLLPKATTNRAGRATTLKHDPVSEFRDSVYICRDQSAPTLIHFPSGAFKGAISSAALRTPGATKTEIGQLVQIITPTVYIYGIPLLDMRVVKQAGIRQTPDVRTRALFRTAACSIEAAHYAPVSDVDLMNLVANGGEIIGIGDGRPEKGKLACGKFELVAFDDERFQQLLKHGARAAQIKALENPVAADVDSEELLAWYESEIVKRGREGERRSTTMTEMVESITGSGLAGGNGNGKGHGTLGRKRRSQQRSAQK